MLYVNTILAKNQSIKSNMPPRTTGTIEQTWHPVLCKYKGSHSSWDCSRNFECLTMIGGPHLQYGKSSKRDPLSILLVLTKHMFATTTILFLFIYFLVLQKPKGTSCSNTSHEMCKKTRPEISWSLSLNQRMQSIGCLYFWVFARAYHDARIMVRSFLRKIRFVYVRSWGCHGFKDHGSGSSRSVNLML